MRKEADITITDDGRDLGKVFCVREMPAAQAERWAVRALMAVAKSGQDIGSALGSGMEGIAVLGVTALMTMDYYQAEPLLDELMTCIQIKPSPNVIRALIDEDIEEVSTRIRLKIEVLQLHVGFSLAGGGSKSTSETSAKKPDSLNTQTFPDPSVRFSRQAKTKPAR